MWRGVIGPEDRIKPIENDGGFEETTMRLTNGSMLQVARDLRTADRAAADAQRRSSGTSDPSRLAAMAGALRRRLDWPTSLRRLTAIDRHA